MQLVGLMHRHWLTLAAIVACIAASKPAQAQNSAATSDKPTSTQELPSDDSQTNPAQLKPIVITMPHSVVPKAAQWETDYPTNSRHDDREWYGGWTLAADGLAIISLSAGLPSRSFMPVYVGLGVYAVGGPIVHLAKGEPVRAVGSFALRVGLPVIFGAALGAANHEDCNGPGEHAMLCGFSEAVGTVFGVGLGMLTAMIVDSAALAYRKVPAKPEAKSAIQYAPNLLVGPNSAVVTLGGIF